MKQSTRKKTVQITSIVLVALMVLGVIWSGIATIMGSRSAAAATYPPLLRYQDAFYMVTGETVDTLPEGSWTPVEAQVVGDQETLPLEEGTCNFGEGTVQFQINEEGAVYCGTSDGKWLVCQQVINGEGESSHAQV